MVYEFNQFLIIFVPERYMGNIDEIWEMFDFIKKIQLHANLAILLPRAFTC